LSFHSVFGVQYRCAIQTSGKGVPAEFFRLKDRKAEQIKRLLRIPSMLGSLDPNQEQTIANLASGGLICLVQTLDAAPHATPSFVPEVAVELAKESIAICLGPVGEMRDEVLDLLPRRFAQGLHATKICGVRLD
jgi:hypothetical protein